MTRQNVELSPADSIPWQRLSDGVCQKVLVLTGSPTDTGLSRAFTARMYAFRNPGMGHGPHASKPGCATIEFRYCGMKGKCGE